MHLPKILHFCIGNTVGIILYHTDIVNPQMELGEESGRKTLAGLGDMWESLNIACMIRVQ